MASLTNAALADDAVVGVFLGPGVECPQFQTADGEQISLRGHDVSGLEPGTQLHLTGTFLRVSPCMQGRTFRVTGVMPVSSPTP